MIIDRIVSASWLVKKWEVGVVKVDERPCNAGTLFMFSISLRGDVTLEKARTIALTTMVFFQFYQAANCRSGTQSIFKMNPMGNPLLFYSVIAAFFAQLAVIYAPTFQWIFRTEPITGIEWVKIGMVASTIIIAVEIDKWVRNKKK